MRQEQRAGHRQHPGRAVPGGAVPGHHQLPHSAAAVRLRAHCHVPRTRRRHVRLGCAQCYTVPFVSAVTVASFISDSICLVPLLLVWCRSPQVQRAAICSGAVRHREFHHTILPTSLRSNGPCDTVASTATHDAKPFVPLLQELPYNLLQAVLFSCIAYWVG